jgi:hypothetical protein
MARHDVIVVDNSATTGAPTKKYVVYGVDGEGYYDTENKTHQYDVFTSGSTTINGFSRHITFDQIIELMREQTFEALDDGLTPLFIGYFYNYDVSQQIRSLDDFELEMINERSRRSIKGKRSEQHAKYQRVSDIVKPLHVENGDPFSPDRYRIDYMEGKYLQLSFVNPKSIARARGLNDESKLQWATVKVQDVGTLFGGSFIKALESFKVPMSDDERAKLHAGKQNRAINCDPDERARHIDEIIEYNRLEIALVYRLIATLYNSLTAVGIEVDITRDLSGIGALAGHYIKQKARDFEIIPSYDIAESITPEFYKAANASYFGGWAETLAPGLHDSLRQYDITSAYPDTMRNLPSLRHALHYKADTLSDARAALAKGAIVYVDIDYYGTTDYCGPLPHRTEEDSVLRPRDGAGIYLLAEVEAAEKAGLIDEIDYNDGWVIEPTSDEKPLAYMEELFNERIRVGKSTPQGQLYKLLMNSQYGKFAQSVGNPTYANAVYASMITAGARIKILEAVASHPNGVNDLLAVATDAAFFRTEHPNLDMTPQTLGAWELTTYRKTFLLKPGIWGGIENESTDEQWSAKTRGIGYKAFVDKLYSDVLPTLHKFTAEKRWNKWAEFNTEESFSMITLGEAAARGDISKVGEFEVGVHGTPEVIRKVTFDLNPKRGNVRWDEATQAFTSDTAVVPWTENGVARSHPYSKLIGAVEFGEDTDIPIV